MVQRLIVSASKARAVPRVGTYIIDWCVTHPEDGLGGATGRTLIPVWKWIHTAIADHRATDAPAVYAQTIHFLDEYFGPVPSYYHWAWRNLRVGRGGFQPDRMFTPRGCFFETRTQRVVNGDRLENILAETRDQWVPMTVPGENGQVPEIYILPLATHSVLREIREALTSYDILVRARNRRLQLLGIGVGGAIATDPEAGGHIGFVEYGAAAGNTKTMLVRLAKSTQGANDPDFILSNEDGDASLEPCRYAVTQGISTILSAGEILLMAWGEGKRKAIERMLLGTPSPKNPAAWVQKHQNVTVFLDDAYEGLNDADLNERGWNVELPDHLF